MNTTVTFRDYSTIQKIGSLLVGMAGLMVLAKILNLLNANQFVEEDLPNSLFLIGGLLILAPFFLRKRNRKNNGGKASLFLLAFCTSVGLSAQDYAKQIAAFEQSFAEKWVAPLSEYVSPELKFDPIPAANTPAILNNIVTNLPKLNAMTTLESTAGKAKVRYDFVGLGVSESFVHFDAEGKFVRIELIENLIKKEIEAQKKMKESVQLPTPGALGDTYPPEEVTFKATDGLLVTGNLYAIGKDKPVILLGHQAGYNREEYIDIAPKLN